MVEEKPTLSPEQIDEIIKIVEKYHLGPTTIFGNPEVDEILRKAKSEEEQLKIIESFPLRRILKKVREILEGKDSFEGLFSLLYKEFNLSSFLSRRIVKEIQQIVSSTSTKTESQESKTSTLPSQFAPPKTPKQQDIYREPIE